MSNMAHCRFENTFRDLQDCYEHLDDFLDGKLPDSENSYAKSLVKLCSMIHICVNRRESPCAIAAQ